MKNRQIIKWSLVGIAALLAAMGLMFTWNVPLTAFSGAIAASSSA